MTMCDRALSGTGGARCLGGASRRYWGVLVLGLVGCGTERTYDQTRTTPTLGDSSTDPSSASAVTSGSTDTGSGAGTSGQAEQDGGPDSVSNAGESATTGASGGSNTGDFQASEGEMLVDGPACDEPEDCESGVCADSVCQPPSCTDGVVNGGELDTDCGGPCGGCPEGAACSTGVDCASRVCDGSSCAAPSCADAIVNGGESDVDCGGPSCDRCLDGMVCVSPDDCQSGVCTHSTCQAQTCDDQVLNGTETDVDCGGDCSPCTTGSNCHSDQDCLSLVCEADECLLSLCGDSILSGNEACDDGNSTSGDGCTADCTAVEDGFACHVAGAECVNIQMCGDGAVQGNERCDLGTMNSDTGECTTACQWPVCGDGFVQPGEQCDDGRLSGAYGTCDQGCVFAPRCGDGKLQAGLEECDEGQGNDGGYEGCTSDCHLGPRCGDGTVDTEEGELCDDGDDIEVNGCGVSCRVTTGLNRWFQFEEGSGSVVNDFAGRLSVGVEYGRRYSRDVPYTDAFVAPTDEASGHIHLNNAAGTDPTDPEATNPIVYVDLMDARPSATQLSLSVWARRTKTSTGQPLLLWLGSNGDGAGGYAVDDDLWAPDHEIWMRYESTDSADPNKFNMSIGFAPSYIVDIADDFITKPSPEPETTKCRNSAKVTIGDWHHYVLTIQNLQNPDGASLIRPVATYVSYVDGQRAGGASECYSVNIDRFKAAFIGRSELATNNGSWGGDVDNFMMYSRVLTEAEVSQLYTSQRK